MFSWNSPYILAGILGIVAVLLFHFDQKQKKEEPSKISYFKVFILVFCLIIAYEYFVDTNITEYITDNTPLSSPITNDVNLNTLSSVNSSIFNPFSNLKIKEGVPNF
jgi:hypothetical protein